MKQQKLFTAPKSKLLPAQARDYDARNLEIAKQFIEDPSLCGGEDSFGVLWARLVLERLEGPTCK